MDTVVERCAGLDVHKGTVAACVRHPGPSGERVQEVHTFGTTTHELLALRDWLVAHAVTLVGMESTGIKLSSVATDILEASGRDMLGALVAGTRDPEVLSNLARGNLRRKIPRPSFQDLSGRLPAFDELAPVPETLVQIADQTVPLASELATQGAEVLGEGPG